MKRGWIGIVIAVILVGLAGMALADVDIENTFPDSNFRRYVSNHFDQDGDGKLSAAEIADATEIDCVDWGIFNMEGIGVLTELKTLTCTSNGLSTLDLSKNTKLEELKCSYNILNEVVLGKNANLKSVICYGNSLRMLDVSGCSKLVSSVTKATRTAQFEKEGTNQLRSWDEVGNVTVDWNTTVIAGSVSSKPLMNKDGSRGTYAAKIVLNTDEVTLGSDQTVSVVKPDGVQTVDVDLYRMDGVVPVHLRGLYGAMNYPERIEYEYYLQEPGTYSVMAVSYRDGVMKDWTVKTFTVTGTPPAAPKVTAESVTVTKDRTARFTITSQDGKTVDGLRYSKTDHNGYAYETTLYSQTEQIDDSTMTYWEQLAYAGDYTYRFSARIGGIWSAYSEPIAITCEALGTMAIPDKAKVPATLKAGEPLVIDFSAVEHGDAYDVKIEGDDYYTYGYPKGTGKLTVLPYGLDAGTYRISIRAYGSGYEPSEGTYDTTLKVTGTRPADPQVTVPKGTYYINDLIWVTFSGDGLESLVDRYQESTPYQAVNGTITFLTYAIPEGNYGGNYLRARINGCWTDEFRLAVPGEERPEEEDTDLKVLSFPESIQLGEDLKFRTELPDEAETYVFSISYRVYDDEEDWTTNQIVYEYLYTPDAKGNGTIPAEFFTAEGDYEIGLDTMGKNFHKYVRKDLKVTENKSRPAAPTVKLLNANPKAYEDAKIRISAKGAKKVCMYIQSATNPFLVMINPIERDMDEDGVCDFAFNMMDYNMLTEEFDYTVKASVFNGSAWSEYSKPISVTFTSDGESAGGDDHSLTMTPEEPTIGDTITLGWQLVRGASTYQIVLDNEIIFTGDATSTSCTVSTKGMETGGHYFYLRIFAAGKDRGYGCKYFRIYNPGTKPTVTADKTVIQPGDTVTLTIGTQDGKYVQIYDGNRILFLVQRAASGKQTVKIKLDEKGTHLIRVCTGNQSEAKSPKSERILIHAGTTSGVLTLPEGTQKIEAEAFRNIKNVTVEIPESLTEVAEDAIDRSVTILATFRNSITEWFAAMGYRVVYDYFYNW